MARIGPLIGLVLSHLIFKAPGLIIYFSFLTIFSQLLIVAEI